MSQKPSIPKGTRDFLPEVSLRRAYIFDTIRTVFEKYGYAPIETPSMENLSVLTGKYGEEGDRLIFKILNNGDFLKKAKHLGDPQKLAYEICDRALRYDLTVPFARFVVMHQHELAFPFKRYQIQPVWRADRPQRGRYREFFQCDADAVGSDSLLFEAEFICMYDEVLSQLGLKDFSVRISNRKVLSGFAEAAGCQDHFTDMCVAIDKLDKIGAEKVISEMEGRGISPDSARKVMELIGFEGTNEEKIAFLRKEFATAPTGQQGLDELEEVFETLTYFSVKQAKVPFDLQLARGLDYYTGTIMEVVTHEIQMGSIGGGGRYDDLTGLFGLKGLPGVGISFGADRIYVVLEELGLFPEIGGTKTKVLLINFGEGTHEASLKALAALREAGVPAERYPGTDKLKKQFGYADKKGIPYTLIIGTEEVNNGVYQLKHMKTGTQHGYALHEVVAELMEGQS
ncbi:MAG: histidine--tRNA ligase [Bacteroidota bacterium]